VTDHLSTGELLRRHRFRVGLTQQQLADRAEVSVRAVRYIEQGGVTRPQASSVRRLADALGLTGPDLDPPGSTDRQPAVQTRVEVLGPLIVRRGDVPIDIESTMVRNLLGLLAIQPGQVVGGHEIVEVLWGDEPPRTCAQLVHTYIAALRRVLEPGRPRRGESSVLRRTRTGYTLDLGPAGTDLDTFADLARSAAAARRAGDSGPAGQFGAQALGLWRGPVVADCGDRLRQHPVAVALAARRLAMTVDHADLALAAGRGADVIASLRALAADEPLHEGLAARLVSALAADGQQAAALELFEAVRSRLDEELGVPPGDDLRAAHLRVLRGQNTNAAAAPAGVPRPAAGPVPAQLPADVATFTGRADHLRQLDACMAGPVGADGPVVAISTLDGMAGVGKTALVVHWGHRMRGRFPDGQLYVDLRGHASSRPLRPIDALAGFLLALGVPPETVPDDLDRAAALYRSTAAGKRVLVVLDNATSADQVRPLLVGTPGSVALVTSRNRIPGLVARDGARQVTVDVLAPGEAEALLHRMLGDTRSDAEPEALVELARLCAYLPLALRIAAANLIARPRHRIADQVARLAAGNRLAALSVDGDADTAVRAAFDLSYAALPPAERRMFRILGLFPGPDIATEVAAALTGTAPDACERTLSRLVDRHLADEPVPGRYTMHDLVRLYAAERATARERAETADRLAVFYLDAADTATRLINPHLLRMPPDPERTHGRPVALSDPDHALAWLDDERANLTAVMSQLAQHRPPAAVRLADTLQAYFRVRINPADWQILCTTALAAAEAGTDVAAKAAAELSLGGMRNFQSRFDLATEHFARALALARLAGWTECEAVAVNNLARMHWLAGRPQQTIIHLEQALTLHRRAGRTAGEAVTLANLGAAYGELARTAGPSTDAGRADLLRAMEHLDQALALHRKVDDRRNEAETLRVLATAHRDAGDTAMAMATAGEALTLARQTQDLRMEVSALNTLAGITARLGDAARAQDGHHQALQIVRDLGERHLEAQTLIESAQTDVHLGLPDRAAAQIRDAMTIIDQIGAGLLERQARAVLDSIHPEAPK
jgi:DNA-binding SARP family transcriptional activator/tetratricopeptide (TPR) repeat protein/DNA-binding XRE family transcriptional regulator